MRPIWVLLALMIGYILYPEIASAASENATFESFYKQSSSIGWIVAAGFAVVAGAAIFFSGGTASPIVVGIGSWIGGTMGLSGIAATNAGLALLGGGSIASGGFGIIGGVTVITAALTFGTDVVFDYTIGKIASEYQYANLAEQSKQMQTLPLPANDSGSNIYEEAVKLLEAANKETPIFDPKNQEIIHTAIAKLNTSIEGDADERLKNETLLSLLYFVSNDYPKAKISAERAINIAKGLEIRRTLPAFIYATSTLYEEKFDFTSITQNYFRYSVLAEPKNQLIPLLFSIYLDRIFLRLNDDSLDDKALDQVFAIMKAPELGKFYVQNYTVMIARYFIRLKLEQQKISSLANTTNTTIKDSPKTLVVIENSLNQYKSLLSSANLVMSEILLLKDQPADIKAKIVEFNALLMHYVDDKARLETMMNTLKSYQLALNTNAKTDQKIQEEAPLEEAPQFWYMIFLISLMMFGLGIIVYFGKRLRGL